MIFHILQNGFALKSICVTSIYANDLQLPQLFCYYIKNDFLEKDDLELDVSSRLPLSGDEDVPVTSTPLKESIKNKLEVSNVQNTSNVLIRSASTNSDSSDHYDHFNDTTWKPSTSADSASSGDCKQSVFNDIGPSSSVTKQNYKKTCCAFCEAMIVSQHFSRHLHQHHKDKSMVKLLMDTQSVKEKRNIISRIRNKGNLVLKMRTGQVIPKKTMKGLPESGDYIVCAICKGFIKSSYIVRHNKKCNVDSKTENKNKANPRVESFILSLQENYQAYLKSEPIRKELIAKLRMDDIGKAALSDPIILEYGLRLLQTAKNIKKKMPAVRNKIRECARLFLKFKEIAPKQPQKFVTIMDILKPEYIDYIVQAVKLASRYSESERSFGAASYALHQGKTVKDLIDIGIYLICKKDAILKEESLKNTTYILEQLKILRNLIETNWVREVGSLALKTLNIQKSRDRSKRLLPLTEDIMKLRDYCLRKGKNAVETLNTCTNLRDYVVLVEVTFMLLLLHNRKRVGDIQYIQTADVTESCGIEQEDEIFHSLSETEKVLAKFYKKIHTIGKGSKEILVLVPRDVQEFVNTLLTQRHKYVESENKFFFCIPYSSDEWINGCYVQIKYSKECGAKLPKLIRSCRLRKHIATMMQLMDLRSNEIGQLATFMGHTEKTHKEFYKLPKDVMMIAKVSKILLKLEKGELLDCKNKKLDEIVVNTEEYVSDSYSDEEEGGNEYNKFTVPLPTNVQICLRHSGAKDDSVAQICTCLQDVTFKTATLRPYLLIVGSLFLLTMIIICELSLVLARVLMGDYEEEQRHLYLWHDAENDKNFIDEDDFEEDYEIDNVSVCSDYPDLEQNAEEENPEMQVGRGNVHFELHEVVLVKDFSNVSKSIWTKGVVIKKIGNKLYVVKVGDSEWKRHCNQMLKYVPMPSISESPTVENKNDERVINNDNDDTVNNESEVRLNNRPARHIRKPNRLTYDYFKK
ncbi:hypothetical protein RN001_000850 [Aquatica leii]|uniref:Uncharacterized protein n=1 Tax=Aquatica leii TaxID=1421715 RepID=A0AAN7SKU8_9COLE|nr:hypothetical protein RN001_000850 [Aquatica leii]